jgi:hypothetical protein
MDLCMAVKAKRYEVKPDVHSATIQRDDVMQMSSLRAISMTIAIRPNAFPEFVIFPENDPLGFDLSWDTLRALSFNWFDF